MSNGGLPEYRRKDEPIYDYVQDTDPVLDVPNTVVANQTWVRKTAPATYAIRDDANTAWVFFSASGGAGTIFVIDNDGGQVTDNAAADVML